MAGDDDGVSRGPLGLKDRSAVRDDCYRRWLFGTRLVFVLAAIATIVIGASIDVTQRLGRDGDRSNRIGSESESVQRGVYGAVFGTVLLGAPLFGAAGL